MADEWLKSSALSKSLGGVAVGTYFGIKIIGGIISILAKPQEEVGDYDMQMLEKQARSGKDLYAEFAYGYNLYQSGEYDKATKGYGLIWLKKAAARGSVEAKEFLSFIGER